MNRIMEEQLTAAYKLMDDGNTGESIKLYFDCLLTITKDSDPVALVHALAGISTNFKILIRTSDSKIYKNMTVAYALESYKVAEESKDKIDNETLSVAYKAWADALMMGGRTKEALSVFEQAYGVAVKGSSAMASIKAHIGGIKYLLGQKEEGIKTVEEVLKEIRMSDVDNHSIRILETGCLNGLAKIHAIEGDRESALKRIGESIVVANECHLPVRLREAEEIKERIESGFVDFDL